MRLVGFLTNNNHKDSETTNTWFRWFDELKCLTMVFCAYFSTGDLLRLDVREDFISTRIYIKVANKLNTLKFLQIWLAVGLVGILIYFYSTAISERTDIFHYRQLCVVARSHGIEQAKMSSQCTLLSSTILVATIGPDFGIAASILGFYIASMVEINLLVERKTIRISK
jgi:hypothetical protein